MRRHTSLLVLAATFVAAIAAIAVARRRGQHHPADDLWEAAEGIAGTPTVIPGATPPTPLRAMAQAKADEVAAKRRAGSPEDRQAGQRPSVGLDVSRLESVTNSLEPVVQYLTYIQSRRGQDSSLLFVRYDDIDAMAELDGEPSDELLERLDQLGVVVSAN